MTLTRKDAVATSRVGLAVLAFLANHEAWTVPLIGDSHRWAAAVIMVLGIAACSAGAREAFTFRPNTIYVPFGADPDVSRTRGLTTG